jgi:hypothetical protein
MTLRAPRASGCPFTFSTGENMRAQLTRLATAIGAALIISTPWSTMGSAAAQSSAPAVTKRTTAGEPDLNGFWQAITTANWDLEEHGAAPSPYPDRLGAYLAQPPGFSVVEGGTIPYKPEALAKKKEFFEKRLLTDSLLLNNIDEDKADPEAKCFQGGVPRSTYMGYPLQIMQSGDKMLVAYQQGGQSARLIHVVGKNKDLVKARADVLLDIDSWMGQSVGRWEGDTLVVDARAFGGTVWLDRAGNFYSRNAHVTERYTPTSPYHVRYQATIDDPDTFTRPWSISLTLYKIVDPKMELLEFQCIPLAEPFLYGSLEKKEKK